MTKATFQLETLSCPSCTIKIEGMLGKTEGVEESSVLFNSSRVKVNYDDEVISSDTIKEQIERLGYSVLSVKNR